MAYFTSDFLDFFSELELNNSKEWFDENRKRYETNVKNPFKNFTTDLIAKYTQEIDHEVTMEAKHAIFRINRDIRFSKDKTPYKTQSSAAISKNGRKDMATPGIYVEMSHRDLRVYSGLYNLDKEQLKKVRYEISYNLEEFKKLYSDKNFIENFELIRGDKNKVLPKEFKEDAETEPLIYNKNFYYFFKLPPETILEDNLIDIILKKYKAVLPLNAFFSRALEE